MKQNRLLTDASQLFCQNEACPARGQVGAKTIVRYGQKRERYQCKVCQKTFSARQGTMFEGRSLACRADRDSRHEAFLWMAGLALKRGTLPSILSQRIIDRMESRSRSESPHTVFVNSAPIFRGTFGGSLLERISRTGQFGTSVDPRIEWENIE